MTADSPVWTPPKNAGEAIERMREDGDADPKGTALLNYPWLFAAPQAAPEAPAPVAFRWRWIYPHKKGGWTVCQSYRPDPADMTDGFAGKEVEPLYAHPAPAQVVGVKPLEWFEVERDRGDGQTDKLGEWDAPSILGVYAINISICGDMHAPWEVFGGDDSKLGNFTTLDKAKAAAQADYERRILSALYIAPAPSPEAIAAAREEGRREGYAKGVKDAAEASKHFVIGSDERPPLDICGERPIYIRNPMADECTDRILSLLKGEGAHHTPALSPGARDVLAERRRQVEVEGWTPEHDDAHDKHEMAQAAACYALTWTFSPTASAYLPHKFWPWSLDWWKPTDTRGCLVKAGALILAEIERLDRAAARSLLKEEGR